jgi:hypothetical protein
MSLVDERTGVLVVRIWTTEDDPPQIRARITRTVDVMAGEQVVSVAGSVEEVKDAVHAWLQAFDGSDDP